MDLRNRPYIENKKKNEWGSSSPQTVEISIIIIIIIIIVVIIIIIIIIVIIIIIIIVIIIIIIIIIITIFCSGVPKPQVGLLAGFCTPSSLKIRLTG